MDRERYFVLYLLFCVNSDILIYCYWTDSDFTSHDFRTVIFYIEWRGMVNTRKFHYKRQSFHSFCTKCRQNDRMGGNFILKQISLVTNFK